MYAVVGCRDCSALWVVEGRPDTTQCPRCRTRHRFDRLKQFVTTDDEDHAREVRASMLANRQGEGDTFAEIDSFADLEEQVDGAGIDDDAYLERSGVDSDAVQDAGDRAEAGVGGATSNREVVLEGLRDLDAPTEEDLIEYAGERGVDAEYVREALSKLRRAGRIAERDGTYRLV